MTTFTTEDSDAEWSLVDDKISIISDSWSVVTDSSSTVLGEDSVATREEDTCAPLDPVSPTLPVIEEGECFGDLEHCITRGRGGKKSLKHSLVKRCPTTPYRMEMIDDRVEVTNRPSTDKDGMRPKTAVDDVLPELLVMSVGEASLGRLKRWEEVVELFRHLEENGDAVRVAIPSSRGCNDRGRYSDPPLDSDSYVVRANGFVPSSQFQHPRHQYRSSNSSWRGEKVYHWHRKRWAVLYEINSPSDIAEEHKPLRATLRATPGTTSLLSRRAFSPGVAGACGSLSQGVRAAQNAVVNEAVDLVFGRPVLVTYASIAGKIHDTTHERVQLTKAQEYKPRYYNSEIVIPDENGSRAKRARIHVAVEGTEAYCDRVEISARLTLNPRVWVSLGVFAGCRDGHTEQAIYLGDCPAAQKHSEAVSCIALRFRALSWHNKPMLRVGAYGVESEACKNQRKTVAVSNGDAIFENGVQYTLHRYKNREDGRDSTWRRYAIKGPSENCWNYGDKNLKSKRRTAIKSEIRDAVN